MEKIRPLYFSNFLNWSEVEIYSGVIPRQLKLIGDVIILIAGLCLKRCLVRKLYITKSKCRTILGI